MPRPQKILIDTETQAMQIIWPDGHESIYDLTYLRRACPCAECQPWKEGVGEPGKSPESVLKAEGKLNAVSDVIPIGGYAIQFHWADGHSYGIYDWNYLRELCPCDEDVAKRRQSTE
ncbi:MAG: DUF971 domain-containing protein [Chloroflexi bacterium]|nr:DUF971 domain-containing protein [Chloroflexota bacterium]